MGLGREIQTASAEKGGASVVRTWEHKASIAENVTCTPMGRAWERSEYRKAPKGLHPRLKVFGPQKIGVNPHLEAFRKLMTVRARLRRGEIIADAKRSAKCVIVLLEGLACVTARHEDGARQIYAFHYPGDFLGLHGFLHPESKEQIEVEALSSCSIGTIDRDTLEQSMQRQPELGRALWQAAMIEASMFRQRLLMVRWPAQQRVAHLLCEQLSRLEPDDQVIPLSQIEVADAVGLSVVHTNRVFQDLRRLGALSERRCIEVVDRKRLKELAVYDGRYLDASAFLSRWDLRIES